MMISESYDPYEEDDLEEQAKPWKCKLCSTENSRGEDACRICDLPRFNKCTKCQQELNTNAHFCKYCGAMSVFFQAAVYDPKEREYARKSSKQLIAEWKKEGIKYLVAENTSEYAQQLQTYGEILD